MVPDAGGVVVGRSFEVEEDKREHIDSSAPGMCGNECEPRASQLYSFRKHNRKRASPEKDKKIGHTVLRFGDVVLKFGATVLRF